jgi:dephospho-CoA kinase
MPLVYITGPTAAGKSALRDELARRGYTAYDTDDAAISTLVNRESGEAATYPANAGDRTKKWLDEHALRMTRERVELLRAEATDKLVFLCGIPGNAHEMTDKFDRIICLVINRETMLQRVLTRRTNEFGKAPAERELILRHHEPTLEWYRAHGASMVDGEQPLSAVADEVLAVVG